MDIHKYTRKLNVKRYMLSNPISTNGTNSTNIRHSGLANASLFNPLCGLSSSIRVFRDVLLKVKQVKMAKDLQLGLGQLCNQKDLVIRPADKWGGGVIVILDKSDYLTELNKIVGDTKTYMPLPSDPRFRYEN